MNTRQRRGVMLLIATIFAAFILFIAIFMYTKEVSSQVGPKIDVVELAHDVKELTPIKEEDVKVVQIPEKWAPEGAVDTVEQVLGKVFSGNYVAGSVLQGGMLIDAPTVKQDYREIAMLVDAETGVAGKIRSGDHVDIIATTEEERGVNRQSKVWIENALVVEVGVPKTVDSENENGFAKSQKVPVTFALPVDQALILAYVESFSEEVRLALRGRGDQGESIPDKFPNIGNK